MWKKDEVKIKFGVTLKELTNVDLEATPEGQQVWISWKRGSKEQNKGDSKRAKVLKGGSATFTDNFAVDSTLFQDQRTKEFKGKNLELYLKEDFNKKSAKITGKAIIDLGKFAHPGTYYSQSVPFFPVTLVRSKKAMLNPPSLRVTWTHFNKKLLIKKPSAGGATKHEMSTSGENAVVSVNKKEGQGKVSSVEVGDEEFDLKTVDNELSDDETTTGWSDEEGEEEDPFSSDEEDKGGKGKQKNKTNGAAASKPAPSLVSPTSKEKEEQERKAKEEKEKKEKEERELKEKREREMKEKEEKERKEREERERKAKEEKERKEKEEMEKKAKKVVDSVKVDNSPSAVIGKGEEGLKIFLMRMGKEAYEELYPRLTKGGITSVETLSRRSFSELRAIGLLYGDCTYLMGCLKNWYPELFVEESLPPKPAPSEIKIVKSPSGDYRARLTAKKKQVKKLKEDYESKRKDKKDMVKQFKEQTKKKRRLKKRFKTQKEEAAAFTKQKEDFEKKIKELEQQVSQAKQTEEKLKKEMEDKLKAAKQESAGKNSKEQDASQWRQKVQEMERENESVKAKNKELQGEVSGLKKEAASLKDELASLKKNLEKSDEKMKEKEKEVSRVGVPIPSGVDINSLREETFERKLVERTVYAAKLVHTGRDSSEDVSTEEELLEEERKQDGAIPTSGELLFKFLKDKLPFAPTPPNTRLLKHIIKAIRLCVKRSSKDSHTLCGWLSYTTSLVHLLLEEKSMKKYFQREVDDPKVYGINVKASRKKKNSDPAVEFINALQDIALTIYISLLQNLHRQISPLLVPAILDQPPFTILQGGGRNYSLVPKHCLKTTDDITILLDDMLFLLETNKVFSSVVKQFFIQSFYLINVTLFNHLMNGDIHSTDGLRENEIGDDNNLYTSSNAFQIKIAISQLVAWIYSHSKSLSYHATKSQFNGISEAANVLCMPKSVFVHEKILKEFPSLNPAQIQHLLDRFQPEKSSGEKVPMEFRDILDDLAPSLSSMPIEEDPFVLLAFDPSHDEEDEPTTPSRKGN